MKKAPMLKPHARRRARNEVLRIVADLVDRDDVIGLDQMLNVLTFDDVEGSDTRAAGDLFAGIMKLIDDRMLVRMLQAAQRQEDIHAETLAELEAAERAQATAEFHGLLASLQKQPAAMHELLAFARKIAPKAAA